MKLIRKLQNKWGFVFTVIFGLGLVIRLYHLDTSSLSGDESIGAIRAFWMYHGVVHHIPTDFYGLIVHSRPPMDLFMSVPAFFIGANEFIIRLPYVLFFMVSALFLSVYIFMKESRFTGLFIFLLLSVSPMTVGWSRLSTVDSLELGVGCLLLVAMDNLVRKKTRTSLIILAVTYGLSFWFIETFVLLAPLMAYLIFEHRRYFSKKIVLISMAIFVAIVLVTWAPRMYFFMFDSRIAKIGFGYQVSKLRLPDPFGNFFYYFRTYFPQSIVWLMFIFALIGTMNKQVRKNPLFVISAIYISSYLFFFLIIYWRHQAYLGNIYIPLLVASVIAIKHVTSRKLRLVIVVTILIIQMAKTALSLQNNDSGTVSIWGFRKPDNLRQAAYSVRSCLAPTDVIKTDVDGYTAALYFNRKTIEVGKTGQEKGFDNLPAAQYLTNSLPPNKQDYPIFRRYSDGSVLYLKFCLNKKDFQKIFYDSLNSHFYEKFWKQADVISFYR